MNELQISLLESEIADLVEEREDVDRKIRNLEAEWGDIDLDLREARKKLKALQGETG